jgi:hypothetical protein
MSVKDPFIPPGGYGAGGPPRDPTPEDFMRRLIGRASDRFTKDWGITVLPDARSALLEPALPHAAGVLREIQLGRSSEPQLLGHVSTILRNAIKHASLDIDRKAVEASMEDDCPYLFWC